MDIIEEMLYEDIKEQIIDVTEEILDLEYQKLSIKALDKLSRKHTCPFTHGRTNTWACGIVYAIGQANFLFDKETKPYVDVKTLTEYFGVSKSTAGTKASEIRKLLKINYTNGEWILPSMMESNSMMWMFEINGIIMDIRKCSLPIQIEAYNKGLIPYIPVLKEKGVSVIKK